MLNFFKALGIYIIMFFIINLNSFEKFIIIKNKKYNKSNLLYSLYKFLSAIKFLLLKKVLSIVQLK
jgi:hypothetical protein